MALALGAILTMVAAATLHAFKRERPRCISRLTPWLVAPIFLSFILTKSRGCMLAFSGVMGVVSLAVVRRNPRWHSILVCGAMLFVIASGVAVATRDSTRSEDNIWTRFVLWQRAMKIFERSPLIGVGIGSFEQVDVRYQTVVPGLISIRTVGSLGSGDYHGGSGAGASTLNSYIQLLLDFGVIGFVVYFAWIWQANRLGREVSAMAGQVDPEFELLRQHAVWNATVVNLTLVFLGIQGLTETCVFVGPNGLMIFAASFGRLVSQAEALRSWHTTEPARALTEEADSPQ
jgi:O-antigen ligase